MANTEVDSDLIKAWRNRQRVRCANNRGTVLSSLATIDLTTKPSLSLGDKLMVHLFLLPFSASIIYRNVVSDAKIEGFVYTLVASGLNSDNTMTTLGTFSGGAVVNLFNKTIYQALFDPKVNDQLDESLLEQYKNNRMCAVSMLISKWGSSTNKPWEYYNNATYMSINFMYTDAGQSTQRFSGAAIEDGYWEDK